ncbi:MAG: hypothetical protein LBG78_00095 [Azoarcus sp.]|jgi:hypothetical protein|nr:hypothetical protein [Azoarcus sp.]
MLSYNYCNFVAATFLVATPIPSKAAVPVQLRTPVYRQTNASIDILLWTTQCESIRPDSYQPHTAFGAKLMALRRAYIEKGGKLLDEKELERELRIRRGGIDG